MSSPKALLLCTLLFKAACARVNHEKGDQTSTVLRTMPAYVLAQDANVLNSSQCQRELDEFRRAVDEGILWSLRMLDSSGEPGPGFLYGNNNWFGSQTLCDDTSERTELILSDEWLRNNTKYRDPEAEYSPFKLNYFVARFRHNSTMQYHTRLPDEDLVTLGLCLPELCTISDISLILNRMFEERALLFGNVYAADFRLMEVKSLKEDYRWLRKGRAIAIGCCLVLSLMLVLVGTVYDVLIHQTDLKAKRKSQSSNINSTSFTVIESEASSKSERVSIIGNILLCFSAYTNTRSIFDTKLEADTISDIHGLRFIAMTWLIMFHTGYYSLDYIDNAVLYVRQQSFMQQLLINSNVSVDTFFFLSGFLVTYVYFNRKRDRLEHKSVNLIDEITGLFSKILKRFIRLTPAYMMTIAIAVLQSDWTQDTSQSYVVERFNERCSKYWWRNILYINTLFSYDSMCMAWSWYLSNDMQFFIIGNILLILSSICFIAAAVVLCALLVLTLIISAHISYINDYVPTLDEQYHTISIIYIPPWMRIGPYLVGMATAYLMKELNNNLPLKKRTVGLIWCIACAGNLLVLFGLSERHISVSAGAAYTAFNRTVWALGVAWVLVACQTKHAGLVHQLLSFKGWIPLSKLTYCAYLVNPLCITTVYLIREAGPHFDMVVMSALYLGSIVSSYAVAYVLALMMEIPYILLMRQVIQLFRRST